MFTSSAVTTHCCVSWRVCPASVRSAGPVDSLPHHPTFGAFRPPVGSSPQLRALPVLFPRPAFSDRRVSMSHLSSTPHIILVHFSVRLVSCIFRILFRKLELCKAIDCRSHVSGKYGTIPFVIFLCGTWAWLLFNYPVLLEELVCITLKRGNKLEVR